MAETADNYIERRFSELSAEGFNNMVVVTDDNVLRMVAGAVRCVVGIGCDFVRHKRPSQRVTAHTSRLPVELSFTPPIPTSARAT